MRVIDQARLWFREGSSDKVYEVDLVELVAGQYVVNFRFGRRGTPLKDGTKTPLPVDSGKARSIFTKLVDEKLAGGYQHVGVTGTTPGPAAPAAGPRATATADGRSKLVGYLRQGARSPVPLGPVLWRVADLDLRDAEPALLELLATSFVPKELARKPDAWRHLLVFALVRCGTSAAIPALLALADAARTPPHLRDLARLAIVRIEPARARDLGRAALQPGLLAEYERADGASLARAAEELLVVDPLKARSSTVGLYLLGDPVARQAVLAIARVARLSNAEATIVRGLFRLAEANRDGELYALLARRIDATKRPVRPFSADTCQYLRRRVARVVRRVGRAGSPDYVKMASAILLGYDDEDAVEPKRGGFGHSYDRFAPFHAFNEILYKHSSRYELGHHRLSVWKLKRGNQPGGPAPAAREEAFPVLWDRAPDALWTLIGKSGTVPVQEMATRALRANVAYTRTLRDDQLASVLATGHLLAQKFAFEIARTRPLTSELARGALASDVPDAHQWVVSWVDAHPAEVAADPDMIALLVTGKSSVIRVAALRILRGRTLADGVARSAAMRAIAILLGLADSPANAERASEARRRSCACSRPRCATSVPTCCATSWATRWPRSASSPAS